MSLSYKKIKDSSEYFLSPIPRWITHYGFVTLVAVALILLSLVSMIRYPEKRSIKVLLVKKSAFAIMDFDTYKFVGLTQDIEIEMPLTGKVHGNIVKSAAELTGNHAICSLMVRENDIPRNIRDSIYCAGEVILNDHTLLETILKK